MKIIGQGIIFQGQKNTSNASNIFPCVCPLPNGRWLATFRSAPRKKPIKNVHCPLTWSDDQGKTWREIFNPFLPPSIGNKQGAFMESMISVIDKKTVAACLYWVDYSNPDLPFFNEKTQGILHSLMFISYSDDNGETWSLPDLIDLPNFNNIIEPALTGPLLVLKNGDLACQFEVNKPYNADCEWKHSAVLAFSNNKGKTWKAGHSIAANDPENNIFYWDQRPSVFADGTVFNLFWTYDNKNAVYKNIHASESKDNGRTWASAWDTGVSGQPGPAVKLPDGRIVLTYIDRTHSPAIKQRISYDGGRSFPKETESLLYERKLKSQTKRKKEMQDAWDEMSKFSMGHPFAVLLPDNTILAAFYAGDNPDCTSIHWVRIKY